MEAGRGRVRRRPPLFVASTKSALVGSLVLACALAAGLLGGMLSPAASLKPLAGQLIYIDPGHGGIDPGACGRNLKEKDVVLSVALSLGVRLEKSGARVVYSRTGDYDLQADGKDDVEERIKVIGASGATLVISLHCNAFSDPAEWGAQTFYNASRNPGSKKLALLIQKELTKATDTPREASARLDHFMLNHSPVPAVTVEIGFLSNPREESLLGTALYRREIAECVRRAVIEFVTGGA